MTAAVTVLLVLAGVLVAAEILAVIGFSVRDGVVTSARRRLGNEDKGFARLLPYRARHGRWIDSLMPHPYLGFVHHDNPPFGLQQISNIGTTGAGVPPRRRADAYVVLLCGGSVAFQLAQPRDGGPGFLETALNARLSPPKGDRFVVAAGALGAWKQPQQTIAALLYADAVDLVVTLDGYNEVQHFGATERLEAPSPAFESLSPAATIGAAALIEALLADAVRRAVAGSVTLSHSHLALAVAVGLRHLVLRRRAARRRRRRTTIETLFAAPVSDDEGRLHFSVRQYLKYHHLGHAIAAASGAPALSLLQPIPAFKTRLPPEERAVVGLMQERPIFEILEAQFEAHRRAGRRYASLARLFEPVEDAVFADPIHCRVDPDGRSPGYEMLAGAIADAIRAAGLARGGASLARTDELEPSG